METLLRQGSNREDALEGSSKAVGPAGRMVLGGSGHPHAQRSSKNAARAVCEWTLRWDNPAVDIVATSLLAAIEVRMEITDGQFLASNLICAKTVIASARDKSIFK